MIKKTTSFADALSLAVTAALLLACYLYTVLGQGHGGDFIFRMSEAQYFLNRINPYDVYTKRVDVIPEFGTPNAYSYVSYLFAAPFALIESKEARLMLYVLCDFIAFTAVGIVLVKERLCDTRAFAITLLVLIASVFFWQHMVTLNYNVIVASALLVAICAARRDRWVSFILAGLLVGLKPSVFIPFVLLLLFRRKLKQAAAICIVQGIALSIVCFWLNIYPTVYFAQLAETAAAWTQISNFGLMSFPVYFGIAPSVLLSITFSVLLLAYYCSRFSSTNLTDFFLVVVVSLCCYYNHVHAWTMVFPFLAALLVLQCDGKSVAVCTGLLILFLVVPKAQSLYPVDFENEFLLLHNTLRFGALGYVLVLTAPRIMHGLHNSPKSETLMP